METSEDLKMDKIKTLYSDVKLLPSRNYFPLNTKSHRGFRINAAHGLILKIPLNNIIDTVLTAHSQFYRTLVFRFDLRLPTTANLSESEEREAFNAFQRYVDHHWCVKSQGKTVKSPKYQIWRREKHTSEHCHWHVAWLVDDKLIQPYKLYQLAVTAWQSALQSAGIAITEEAVRGLVYQVKQNPAFLAKCRSTAQENDDGGKLLALINQDEKNEKRKTMTRNNWLAVGEVVFWLSYLCKHEPHTELGNRYFRASAALDEVKGMVNPLADESQNERLLNLMRKGKKKSATVI